MKKKLIIGTRPSKLAVAQTQIVVKKLKKEHPQLKYEIKKIHTDGDRRLDKKLSELQSKGLFVKEIEIALLNGEIDVAVHSAKDLPTKLPEELEVAVIADRANPLDTLVGSGEMCITDLPPGARLGTGSLRRRSQLLNYRNDLEIIPVRGNVDTRIKKMDEKNLDGLILAASGLERLNLENEISEYLDPEICLPAARQGAIALEIRRKDQGIKERLKKVESREIAYPVLAEQSFLSYLEAGCHAPIAAYGQIIEGELSITGAIGRIDGSKVYRESITTDRISARKTGIILAEKLLAKGADRIMIELREELN
ncbi:MAG: hydroxymethylbilane synthase [Halanaerobiales bacterium]